MASGPWGDTLVGGKLKIIVAPAESAPSFKLDAVVAEEDTFLVLGADPVAKENYESPQALTRSAAATEPAAPGSVVVREGSPLRLLAVIHDLELEPSWSEEWVASALSSIFLEAEARRLSAIALPTLGTLHGSLEPQRFVELLKSVLDAAYFGSLERLWLVVPRGTDMSQFRGLVGTNYGLEM